MASTLVLLLLLVSLASASHYYGGHVNVKYKGRNPDGTFRVDIHKKDTYDGCRHSLSWHCYTGNCGSYSRIQRGILDSSTNAPIQESQWCETETVETRNVPSDKPFQLRAYSCCWIRTRNSEFPWRLATSVDLGSRSDTGKPNRSPEIAILPFLRVPQNCPRTYKLMSNDPDGDHVRCRYGNVQDVECGACNQPSGFTLDQDSCSLHHHTTSTADTRPYGFELMVEDFPQRHINLTYTDGSQSSRAVRRKRWAWMPPFTASATTTTPPTTTPTTQPTTIPWWYWFVTSTTTPSTTTYSTTTPPTTTHSTTTPSTTTPPTTTYSTTTPPTTTHSTTTPPTTTPPTTTHSTTTHSTTTHSTTTPPTTTTSTTTPPTTTTSTTTPPTTTHSTTTHSTTTPPTTTTSTTTPPTTTTSTTTPPTTTTSTTTPPTTTTSTTTHSTTTHSTTTHSTTTPPTTTTSTTTPPTTTHSTTTHSTTTPPTTTHSTTTHSTTTHSTTTPPTTTTSTTTPPTTTPSTTTPPTTTPLSKLPLQFSLLVDPSAPSCEEGLYLPEFTHPTPENEARIQAQVNKEVEIRVKAKAKYATIDDIIFSGPLNSSKHRTTHNEFVIRWTPVPDDLGDQYPVCFAVESVNGSSIYQSEMRCVLVVVVEELVKSNVICHESTMTVEIEKSSFSGLHEDHLQLNDGTNTACNLQTHSNNTHIIGVIPLNACGTEIEEDEENIIFKNEITTVDDIGALITRKHLLEVQFCCVYPKHGKVSASFLAHRKDVTVWEKGLGTFTYQFEFYPDSQFQAPIDPNSYPLEYDIGSRIFMQIEAVSTINNTELFVESCKAAPYDSPNYSPSYGIIDHGCNTDMTVQIHSPSHHRQFRFSMEAFRFIGKHEQVYISCSVLICEAGNSDTRCAKGCTNPSQRRRKREAVIQSSRHFISQGPLRLKRSPEITGSPTVMNLNMNLVFIAGCLLAAVGMICALAMYKVKMSKVKYEPLPTFES